ncbi:dephospho-CoA kinase/protein folding accessory domain-containing protein [uncultured Ruminococcus sp.]|nr:dephospho-CoA kinase/protein folding accessory domain-containing protein [uncultured Ruminococcus sp.]SCH32087.1 dephospho-CoA kinase/protein folding accessory domain-containing protein [uncultured Clostridium sp.]
MCKPLNELSLHQLWQLFPIQLVPHNPAWKEQYHQEAGRLKALFANDLLSRISHIGSTAVPAIWAKPIVDILAEFDPKASLSLLVPQLEENGWICMSKAPNRISLNKGYTEQEFAQQVFHLHLRRAGDCDELYFRDYLNHCPETAKDYEALKRTLWKKFQYDRDAYTSGKEKFITVCTRKAKQIFPGKYELASK